MRQLECGSCRYPIPQQYWSANGPVACPVCAHTMEITLFPAAGRNFAAAAPQRVLGSDEATCYHHLQNRAVVACEACGRFVCSVCDVEVSGLHVCPSCFSTGKLEVLAATRVRQRTNHDTIALAMATLPMFTCWLPVVTTPYAVYHALRHWNDPAPVMPRGKWRLWLTMVVAVVQVVLAIGLVVAARMRPVGTI